MSDIVERLRAWSPVVWSDLDAPEASTAIDAAADEITSLRAENERLRARIDELERKLERTTP